MPDTGYSFTPSNPQSLINSANQSALTPQASQALQILSLHLPAFLSGNPIAPDALLRRPMGQNSVAAQVSGVGAPSTAPAAAPAAPAGLGAASPQGGLQSLASAALSPQAPPPPQASPAAPTPSLAPASQAPQFAAPPASILAQPPDQAVAPSTQPPPTPTIIAHQPRPDLGTAQASLAGILQSIFGGGVRQQSGI